MVDDVTQDEADSLLASEKRRVEDGEIMWPSRGAKICIDLESVDGREEFQLDIATSAMKLTKLGLQNRARTTVILESDSE